MVNLEEDKEVRAIVLKFFKVPRKSIYNYTIGRSITTMFTIMASLTHLKQKYHNIHDEHIMICTGLSSAQ